jgi:hypothetical protein
MTDVYGAEAEEFTYDPTEDDRPEDYSPEPDQPLYRVYKGSRIAIGKSVGPMWEKKFNAARKAYEHIYEAWNEVFRYYNNNQVKATAENPRGLFKRGDDTENFVFSNMNVMLPAVYSKDPDISCSTTDKEDEPFCQAMQRVLNTIFQRRDMVYMKPKAKRAVAFALLTNQGVLKLDFTKKSDSREQAAQEFQKLTEELATCDSQEAVECVYGKMQALEHNMEVLKPSGPACSIVLPHNLIMDAYAEQPDGLDGQWMMEIVFLPTAGLNALYTDPDPESDMEDTPDYKKPRVLTYKPTHKASFKEGGQRDDGLGLVMEAFNRADDVTTDMEDERKAYLDMYFTECVFVWDKAFRRVFLFQRDDWTWPVWVWDDPLGISRFFPYFVISFVFSTGGSTSVGETAYYLDQQDAINDINRQTARIRRSLFNFFYYNSDKVDQQQAEKFIESVRGEGAQEHHMLGVAAGEMKISDMIETLLPPSGNFEQFFDKTNLMEAINRISNTSDAIRGVQFRTNTNVPAVQMYQQAAQLNVGSKVDVLEDTLADFAHSLAELCVMNYSKEDIVNLVGANASAGWRDMTLAQFQTMYNVRIVAGSMEKPNSAFKKKEALEVGQVLGQFAQAAPGAVLRVLLRLYSQAFTDVIIKPEDWAALDQEIQANLQRGVSTAPGQQGMASTQPTAQQPQQGAPGVAPQQSGAPNQQQQEIIQLMELAQQLPPEAQAQIVQLSEQGAAPEQILQAIQQLVMQSMGGAQAGAAGAQQGQQAVPTPTSANGAGNASYQ